MTVGDEIAIGEKDLLNRANSEFKGVEGANTTHLTFHGGDWNNLAISP